MPARDSIVVANATRISAKMLREYPVWESALDLETHPDYDESAMRGLKRRSTLTPKQYGRFVSATLISGSKQVYLGLVLFSYDAKEGKSTPTPFDVEIEMLRDSRNRAIEWLNFDLSSWTGKPRAVVIREMNQKLRDAGSDPARFFPLVVMPHAPLKGLPMAWVVPGYPYQNASGRRMFLLPRSCKRVHGVEFV